MTRLVLCLFLLLLSVPFALAQSIGTLNLQGPSTGRALITPSILNSGVNNQLSTKTDTNGGTLTSGTLTGTFVGNPTLSGNVAVGGTLGVTGVATALRFAARAPITFSTSANSSPFLYSGNISGTITETPTLFGGISVSNDTATTAGGIANLWETIDNAKAGFTGSRTGMMSKMNILGVPGDAGGFYVATEGDSFANSNAGGASLSSPGGSLRGAEFGALLGTGATFYGNVGALEVSAGIQSGASSQFRSIVSIEAISNKSVRGASFDSGITFSQESTTTPMLGIGIAFGHTGHRWYFASDSCLICAVPRSLGVGGGNAVPLLADRGEDYSKVLFTTASLTMPGYSFDPTGQLSIGNAAIKRTATGMSLDIPNLIVTGGTPSVAGAGYIVADLVYEVTSGSIFTVATINGGGGITGLTLSVPGALLSAPGGAVALTGGNGNGLATVSLTTAANQVLSLNPSGTNTVVGTGSALATSATSGFLQIATTAGAPTGNCGGAAGKACIVIDTTNKKFCWNVSGTTWECSVAFTP